MKTFVTICMFIVGCAVMAPAHTSALVEKTCPLCDTEFKARMDMSGTQVGTRLDLKPVGYIAAPWSVAVCTKCKFVLYGDEIPEAELAKCKVIVESPEYKKHKGRASYFLWGLLWEGLKRDNVDVAHIFLKASWQEESNEKHLKEVLSRSLKYFDAYLKEGPPKKNEKADAEENESSLYNTARLLKGEILRRLGRFTEAKKHLQSLLVAKEFQGNFLGDIVRHEIKLCDEKDAEPHEVSEVKRTGKKEEGVRN